MGLDHGAQRPRLVRRTSSLLTSSFLHSLTYSLQLFGASALTKDLMGVADYHKATWGQNFVASIAGAVASITVAAPLDVIKTRIQNANFETRVHGLVVFRELVRNEGIGGLFKGLTPKVCAAACFKEL